jgi:uroporphyrinogen III methyltransferase/synthase
MGKAKVYFVGTGPGAADLITVKGIRAIPAADVILYDHLIPVELLQLARHRAELIPVGKFAGRHTLEQEKINALIVEKARAGNTVVRLKGGTPFLFGRGGEEAEACSAAGVEFEVVPGVTSALAGAAYAGIPPTHRDCNCEVAIVTGHRRDDAPVRIPDAGTLIFLMAVSNIEKIIAALLDSGRSAETPIAAVENATLYNQRVITGTLGDFPGRLAAAGLKTPAIFIVGKVVELRKRLDWFGARPRVLVVGTHPEKYSHLGTIVHRPLIETAPLEDYAGADRLIAKSAQFDWIVFSSNSGVRFFFERLDAAGRDARSLAGAKIAAIGATTAEQLKGRGIAADIVPKDQSSAGLFEEFRKTGLERKKFLLVKPVVGSTELSERLSAAGASVETVAVYTTVEIEPAAVDFDFIDKILFTSGSTVRAFLNRYGPVPEGIEVLCLGKPTLEEAKRHGIKAGLMEKVDE